MWKVWHTPGVFKCQLRGHPTHKDTTWGHKVTIKTPGDHYFSFRIRVSNFIILKILTDLFLGRGEGVGSGGGGRD